MRAGRIMRWIATRTKAGLVVAIALAVAGGCEARIQPGKADPGEVGAPCVDPTSCTEVSGAECLRMGTDGYCAKDCGGLGQLLCPDGTVCEELADQAVFCMDGCCSQNDCRPGFRCARKPEIDIYQDLTLCPEPGICLLACTADSSCAQGQVCDLRTGECRARVGLNSGVGAPCTSASACNSGTCLTTYPGGYCTSPCGTQFGGCEPGSECYDFGDGTATCMDQCSSDATCRSGYRCEVAATSQQGSVRGFCVPRCDVFGTCPDGTGCDAATGECRAGAGGARPVGAFCAGASDCLSGDCRQDWPNGYCTATCGSCGAGQVCQDGGCLTACASRNDCRFAYACIGGACVPGCTTDSACGAGQGCDTASGACVETTATTASVTEFTTTSLSISDQGSTDVTFTVPSGALSAVLHLEDQGSGLVAPLQLFAPGDVRIYDIQDPAASRLTFLPSDGTFTGMFPNSPAVNLTPGQYRVNFVRADATANAQVRVFGKVAAGFPARQALPVALYFVGAPQGLDAAAAAGDSRFQQALQRMVAIYDAMGITLETPTYEDLGGDVASLQVIDTVSGAGSELSALFRRGSREGALQFYFVDEILGGEDGFVILGIAGGIPGPPGLAGGPHSGVAVTLSGVLARPQILGSVMAHEGAHFMGLFHTSESSGTSHDPLPDTLQCPAGNDENWDGLVSPEECAGAGADNFMFWAASDQSGGVSAEQGRVLRRNPLTR